MPKRHKAAIALSGGVDSAVAAVLLRRQGWNLKCVHLRLTSWGAAADWVQALAQRLEIPLQVIDLH